MDTDEELLFPEGLTLVIKTTSGKDICDVDLSPEEADIMVTAAIRDYLHKAIMLLDSDSKPS